jgi:hypothetical protein
MPVKLSQIEPASVEERVRDAAVVSSKKKLSPVQFPIMFLDLESLSKQTGLPADLLGPVTIIGGW